MHKVFFETIKILLILTIFSACSKNEDLSAPEKVYISVVFTPEGFCNMGYNDITLKAIETCSHKYDYEYSFCVPETIEDGMAYYEAWCDAEIEDNTRCLFIFSSKIYEKHLAEASHPSADSGKEILIFEVEKELPYAYTFALSYYGAAYMIGLACNNDYPVNFQIIAGNPYLSGLNYVIDGFSAAVEDMSKGSVKISYLDESPDGGLDDDDSAFSLCKMIDYLETDAYNLFIPYAGLSNLGVYRFSQSNYHAVVGVDCIDPDLYSYAFLCMNKRIDLALDDFLNSWISGGSPQKCSFYTLESGKVVVDKASMLDGLEMFDKLYEDAIIKEKEYFSKRAVNE